MKIIMLWRHFCRVHIIIIIIGFLINVQLQGQHPHQWAPFQIAGLLPRMADLTPDLQVRLSWGLIADSFHSLQSLSVSCFHVILGLPGPRFPSTCMSKAVLTAPLERSTCPYHRSLLSRSEWGPDPQCQHCPVILLQLLGVRLCQFCVEVLPPSQPNGVMSSAVSLPIHTFTGQT